MRNIDNYICRSETSHEKIPRSLLRGVSFLIVLGIIGEKAGYVVIMDRGQIIAEGTPNELKNRYSYDSLLSYRKRDEAFEKGLCAEGYRFSYDGEKRAYRIVIENSEAAKRLMQRFDGYTTDIEIIKGTMDDVFLNVTGRDIVTGEEHGENKA